MAENGFGVIEAAAQRDLDQFENGAGGLAEHVLVPRGQRLYGLAHGVQEPIVGVEVLEQTVDHRDIQVVGLKNDDRIRALKITAQHLGIGHVQRLEEELARDLLTGEFVDLEREGPDQGHGEVLAVDLEALVTARPHGHEIVVLAEKLAHADDLVGAVDIEQDLVIAQEGSHQVASPDIS